MTASQFGLLYGGATLASAMMLPFLGSRIDQLDLRWYTASAIAGLGASALLVGSGLHVGLLCLGLLGLRLTGQGLMGHISQTVMAREFGPERGRALGLAGLGYPLGEAVLPLAAAVMLGFVPWNYAWFAVAAVLFVVVLPAALRLVSGVAPPMSRSAPDDPERRSSPLWKDRRIWTIMPSLLTPPFMMTGLFLYQMPLAGSKGWGAEWVAAAFTCFALSRAFASIAGGKLIDRYSALRLTPFYTLPLAAAMLALAAASSPWALFPSFALLGLTGGTNGAIASAVWAEIFGVERLGAIRSSVAALGVLSAAACPALMGALLDHGVGFGAMLLGGVALVLAGSAASLVSTPRYVRAQAETSAAARCPDLSRGPSIPRADG